MTVEQWIKINQSIRVSRDMKELDWFDSNIQDVQKGKFYITVPYQKANPLILGKGDQVIVNIVLQGARVEFKSALLGRRVDNIPLYILSWPDDYNRVQDRKFVRLPVIMDIFYAEVPKEGESPRYIKSSLQDISGGGVRMLVKNMHEAGTVLMMKFNLLIGEKTEEIAVSGKVVRSSKISATAISAAVEFINITNRQQDIIVRFILNKLAKSRKPR